MQGRELRLTNLDKVLFPARPGEEPVTKRDFVRYHAQIAPYMLRYLHDRPVNLHRYPDGVDKPGFWHKEVPGHAPEWLTQWRNEEAEPGETVYYAVVDSVPALVWMANFGAVELNPWTSRLPNVHEPTWALIDVDPGTRSSLEEVLVLARLYRSALAPGGGRGAEGHREARCADLGAGGAGVHVRRRRRGWRRCRARSGEPCPTW